VRNEESLIIDKPSFVLFRQAPNEMGTNHGRIGDS